MSTIAKHVPASALRHARQEAVIIRGRFTIATGTTGVSASDVDDPGFTLTRTGVGLYTLTYPASPDDAQVVLSLVHGGGGTQNILVANLLVNTPTSGTCTIQLGAVGAPFTGVDNTETTFEIDAMVVADTGLV